MYFWKTKKLSAEIKENTLTEKDWKQYFLGSTLLINLSIYLIQLSERTNMVSLLTEAILMIGIVIVGVNIAFNTNGGNNGSNFVARITALSFPLSIKIIFLSFAFGIVLVIITEMTSISVKNQEWATEIFAIAVQVLYFWRINVHFKFINT